MLLVLCLLCQETALFLAFCTGLLNMAMFLSFHLGLCAMTASFGLVWVRISSGVGDARDKVAVVFHLAAWTTVAGPFGTLITAALLVPRRVAPIRTDDLVETEPHSELTRLELLQGSLLDRRLRLERAHGVRSLLDVIIDGTQIEKFDALSLIYKRYVPALAPALQQALEDRDGSVRVLAATVMAQQHNAYTNRIGALQTIANGAPNRPEHWSNLAQAHMDYAECGLLASSRINSEVSHALTHLARANQLDPGNAVTQACVDAAGRYPAGLMPTGAVCDLDDER
jgi:hypothetical protein